jgi:type I restriction enzyme, S subunit
MEKQNNVPKLRFPEFSDAWEVKSLGEVADISSGGTPNRAIPYYWNGNIPWVSTTLIDFNTITETNEFVTDEGLKNSSAKLFPIGTLLMAMYGQGKTRGKIAFLGIEASTNQACCAIMVNKNILDYLFVFQNLAKRYDEIRDLSNQGGQENLSGGIIKGIEIPFPTLPEQQKIATFLSTLDEKLQALKKKKSLLEVYKKGVMQKLFSQEIRFKDDEGNDFEDWNIKKLGELNIYISDGNYGELYPKASEMKKSGVPFIRANNIKNLSLIWDDMKFIEEEHHKILQSGHLLENDILVTTRGDIGMVAYVSKEFKGANINAQICLLRVNNNLNAKFLLQYLGSDLGLKQFKSLQTGTALKQLPKGNLIRIELPHSCLPEQNKIANFLTAIDKKINKVDAQINQTELWKKGLLQGMFV